MATAMAARKQPSIIELTTWEVDAGHSAEYENYCQQQRAKRQTPLNFKGWLLYMRRTSDSVFDEVRRRADILQWSDECFLAGAEECMRRYGKYFGVWTTTYYSVEVPRTQAEIEQEEARQTVAASGGAVSPVSPTVMVTRNWYAEYLRGAELKRAPRPWDVKFLQAQIATAPTPEPSPTTNTPEENRERTKLHVISPCRALVPATKCTQCLEIRSERMFEWYTTVIDSQGLERIFNFCTSPRCCTQLNETELANASAEGRRTIRCYRCQHDMCVACGAIKRPLMRKLVAATDSVMDALCHYPGSEPYRRAAHRAGFTDRAVRDIYIPPNAADVRLIQTLLSATEPDARIIERAARKLPYDKIDPTGDKTGSSGPSRTSDPAKPSAEVIFQCQDRREMPGQVSRIECDLRIVGTYDTRLPEISFEEIHEKNPSDQWFKARNNDLYDMAVWFASEWFGDIDFPTAYEGSAWLEELGPQFINYANLVGHEDEMGGDWETMMKNKEHRKWLVVGILAQIIEKKIYNELLFGAPLRQTRGLDRSDLGFLKRDGYERAAQRAATINLILERRLVPEEFWPTVDNLSAHAMEVFLPLINILCSFRNSSFWTDPFRFYASLREIIAHAGYYSVTMRRSLGIFHVLSATPGARMDYPIESQASYELYRLTKEEAERREAVWVAAEKARMERATAAGRPAPELEEMKKAYNLESYHRLRGAKVKYAVWPMIKRYKPENVGKPVVRPDQRGYGWQYELDSTGRTVRKRRDPEIVIDVEEGEGQRIVDIGRCVVIYYQGVIYPKPPAGPGDPQVVDGLPLLAHVATRAHAERRRRQLRYMWLRFWSGLAVSVAFYLSYETLLAHLRRGLPVLLDEALENAKHVSAHTWVLVVLVMLGSFRGLRHFVVGGAFISAFVFVVGYVCIEAYLAVLDFLIIDPRLGVTDSYTMF